MAETQTDEDDPSDLDITKIVRRDLKKSASALAGRSACFLRLQIEANLDRSCWSKVA